MTRHPPSFAWTELTPGIWQRDIDEVETFWAQAAKAYDTQGRKPFAITGHVSLRLDAAAATSRPDINTALRKAWCAIRQDHPSIASRADYDYNAERFIRKYQTVRNSSEREAWLDATFHEVSNGQSGLEFANSDPPAPDFPMMFILTPSSDMGAFEYRDIIFRAPHDTIDGIGTLLLLGNILKHASDALEEGSNYILPELNGSEVQNLSPPYRTAAAVPRNLSKKQKERVDRLTSEHIFLSRSSEPKQYLSLPFRRGAQVPGRHQVAQIILDQVKSSRIRDACRAINATVTQAFNAAVPIVLRDLVPGSRHKGGLYYRGDLLRNLRPFCIAPFNTSKHPVAAYHAGSSFGLEIEVPALSDTQSSKGDFHRVLHGIRTFYHRVADDSDHWYLAPSIWGGLLQGLPRIIKDPLPGPPPSPAPGVSLSSLGRIDDVLPPRIGRLSVRRPWITGEEMGNGCGLFLTSYQGEMTLTAAYNDAWQDKADIQTLLQACLEVVCNALDI